jgi:flagellin
MGMRINTNVEAFNAQRNLSTTAASYAKSVEKLSSGLRINRAGDDAAGLSISEKLRAQIKGLGQAQRNAQDGISMIQTSEGALSEVHSMLQRMRELAVQSSNDTLSTTDRAAVNTELQQLKAEVNSISSRTKFNGQALLTGSLVTTQSGGTAQVGAQFNTTGGNLAVDKVDVTGAKSGDTYTLSGAGTNLTLTRSSDSVAQTISVGAVGANSTSALDFGQLGVKITVASDSGGKTAAGLVTDLATKTVITAAGSGSANFQVGSNASDFVSVAFSRVDVSASGLSSLDTALTNFNTTQSVANAQALITAVDTSIDSVNATRSTLGAYQNRLEHTISNLGVAQENLTASESRIRDVDMAEEMVKFTKSQILQQAGSAILAQANQAPQGVLSLLRG